MHIHQQRTFLNHFPDARLDQVVALHFRRQSTAHVCCADHGFSCRRRVVVRLARQVSDFNKARRHLVSSPRLAHTVFQHRRKRAAVEGIQIFFFGQRTQTPRIFRDDAVAHGHLLIELHAHFEDFAEVLLVFVQQLVQRAVADEDHLDVDVDGFWLLRASAERIEHFQRLNFQPVVVQRALQSAPHADFRQRFQRIHDQEAAIGAEQRPAAQIHEVAGPATSRVIGPLNGPEQIGVRGRGLENNW